MTRPTPIRFCVLGGDSLSAVASECSGRGFIAAPLQSSNDMTDDSADLVWSVTSKLTTTGLEEPPTASEQFEVRPRRRRRLYNHFVGQMSISSKVGLTRSLSSHSAAYQSDHSQFYPNALIVGGRDTTTDTTVRRYWKQILAIAVIHLAVQINGHADQTRRGTVEVLVDVGDTNAVRTALVIGEKWLRECARRHADRSADVFTADPLADADDDDDEDGDNVDADAAESRDDYDIRSMERFLTAHYRAPLRVSTWTYHTSPLLVRRPLPYKVLNTSESASSSLPSASAPESLLTEASVQRPYDYFYSSSFDPAKSDPAMAFHFYSPLIDVTLQSYLTPPDDPLTDPAPPAAAAVNDTVYRRCASLLRSLVALDPQYQFHSTRPLIIVKPVGLSRGRGIALHSQFDSLNRHVHSQADTANVTHSSAAQSTPRHTKHILPSEYILQKYLNRPFVIHGRKFDIRQWVLLTRFKKQYSVYYYVDDCYCRFSLQQYSTDNLSAFTHLTNHSVQELHTEYVGQEDHDTAGESNVDCGSGVDGYGDRQETQTQWSGKRLSSYLENLYGIDVWTVDIQPMMMSSAVAAIMAALPEIDAVSDDRHCDRYSLFGFDYILDESLRPWLIEVNSSPTLIGIGVGGLVMRMVGDTITVITQHKQSPLRERALGTLDSAVAKVTDDRRVGGWMLVYDRDVKHDIPAARSKGEQLTVRGQSLIER